MTLRRLDGPDGAGVRAVRLGVRAAPSEPAGTGTDPVRVEGGAAAPTTKGRPRYRSNQSRHWRHVAIGNNASAP